MPNPLDAEDLRARVQAVLHDHLEVQSGRLAALGAELAPLMGTIAALLADGKRLRAAFCYWGWRAAGGADCAEAVRAATSFELFQAAALLHDDVMDASDIRRGRPTAHRRMSALHHEQGWLGDPDRFGTAAAILAGDLCLSWCDELLVHCGLDWAAITRARPTFDLMRTQLMGGQYLDVLEQVRPLTGDDAALERARRVIRFKSAKYTVEHPMLVGGQLAGAGGRLLAGFSAFALPLGEAFQLRDDVLGVFGDPAQTGKPAGDDLREGKRTVLVTQAYRRSSPAGRQLLERDLGRADLDDASVTRLRDVLHESGAVAEVEALISALVSGARQALASAEIVAEARVVLDQLVVAATTRVS